MVLASLILLCMFINITGRILIVSLTYQIVLISVTLSFCDSTLKNYFNRVLNNHVGRLDFVNWRNRCNFKRKWWRNSNNLRYFSPLKSKILIVLAFWRKAKVVCRRKCKYYNQFLVTSAYLSRRFIISVCMFGIKMFARVDTKRYKRRN